MKSISTEKLIKAKFEMLKQYRGVVSAFIELVERRAENKMIMTGKLEGSHYAAMKELQKEINS